ncbi:hypothetical protein AX14_004204 [Amanita brunnescens Koide BX004]|nr:hypothetical protein AX14_004204 [Amanita brunnescens Koide BX004]
MLLLHALLVFLLSISAMAAPVQGSDAKPPEPPEIKQIFHFYHGGIDTPFSLSYMKKLRGFWQTVVKIERKKTIIIVFQDPESDVLKIITDLELVRKYNEKIFNKRNIWTPISTRVECNKLEKQGILPPGSSSHIVEGGSVMDQMKIRLICLDTLRVYTDAGGTSWFPYYDLKSR